MANSNNAVYQLYKPVDEIEIGDTVVNLGIVKRRFYNPVKETIKLTFNPCRTSPQHELEYIGYYDVNTKLMVIWKQS